MNKSMSEILSHKSRTFFLSRGYVESSTYAMIPLYSEEEIDALEFRDRLKKLCKLLMTLETICYRLHIEDGADHSTLLGEALFVFSNLDADECSYEADEAMNEVGLFFGFPYYVKLSDFMHIQNYDAFLGSDEGSQWWEVTHGNFGFSVRDVESSGI